MRFEALYCGDGCGCGLEGEWGVLCRVLGRGWREGLAGLGEWEWEGDDDDEREEEEEEGEEKESR